MATSKENDLIGYDPLAWMEGGTDTNEEIIDNGDSDDALEEATESEILSDLSDAEESGIKEDESVTVGFDGDNNSVLVEEVADDCADAGDDMSNEGALNDVVATTDNSTSEPEGEAQLDLDATLTIQNVIKLHEKLKDLLAIHDQIEINASDVASIDTATLQSLVSLKKDEAQLQKKITIIYPSPRFVESAQLLGLLDVLDVHEA
jgi:anti-anti-sigma regulatory factor